MCEFHYEPPENILKLQKQLQKLNEQHPQWLKPITEALEKYNETFRPLFEASEAWSKKIEQITSKIEIPPSLKVIEKMKRAQYVFWDFLSQSFIDDLTNNYDMDCELFEYECQNDFYKSESIIKECFAHRFLESQSLLFSQALEAYHEGKYNLAVIGFTAIIDAVLSEATKNPTHKPIDRCNAVLDKLIDNESVAADEYATLTLYTTFHAVVKTFYETISFSDPEPKYLNRNWIMHGRSHTENTRLDCIKLLRFIYGIILIYDINKHDTMLSQEISE